MRTNRIRTTVLAATALAAALSLTACGGEDKAMGTKPAGAAETATPAATNTDNTGGTDDKAQPDAPKAGTPDTQTVPAEGKHAGRQRQRQEAGDRAEREGRTVDPGLHAQELHGQGLLGEPPDQPPAAHGDQHRLHQLRRLLRAVPPLRRRAGGVPGPRRQQAAGGRHALPGQEAYAGISLLGEPGQNEPVKSENLGVIMVDKNNESAGESTLKLPAETYTDSLGFVTYWQSDVENALMF